MINILRVDDKLLHGQVAFSWVRNMKIQTIVIADDQIAYDEFMKMTLGLSKPNGIHLQIMEVSKASRFLQENVRSSLHIMAIVRNMETAYRMMHQIPEITVLNLGSLRERYDTMPLSEHVAFTQEDIRICEQLIAEGKTIEVRERYQDARLDGAGLLSQLLTQLDEANAANRSS